MAQSILSWYRFTGKLVVACHILMRYIVLVVAGSGAGLSWCAMLILEVLSRPARGEFDASEAVRIMRIVGGDGGVVVGYA